MEFVDTSIVEQIEMKMIRPSQFTIRNKLHEKDPDDEMLLRSIREHGLLQPILIRPLFNGFEIICGHRRFRACRGLRWRFIPCKIREMSDVQAFEIQLTENIQRKSMNPIEEAEAFRKYVVEFGWGGVSDLAKKIGKSEEYVSHRIRLLNLSDDIKRQIISNQLKLSQAIELTSLSSQEQIELVNDIRNDHLTVKQIRKIKATLTNEIEETVYQAPSHKKSNSDKTIKKTTLVLKIALARIDNLIDEVHTTTLDEKASLIAFLMRLRLEIHSMIDETIRFKNKDQKLLKVTSKNTIK